MAAFGLPCPELRQRTSCDLSWSPSDGPAGGSFRQRFVSVGNSRYRVRRSGSGVRSLAQVLDHDAKTLESPVRVPVHQAADPHFPGRMTLRERGRRGGDIHSTATKEEPPIAGLR